MTLTRIFDLLLSVAVAALMVVSFGWWNQKSAHAQQTAVQADVMRALLEEKKVWNQDLIISCVIEVKEEVKSEYKFSNLGLIDTLKGIDSLVRIVWSADDAALGAAFQQYQRQLDSLVQMPYHGTHKRPDTHDFLRPGVHPVLFRAQLLDWELAALNYFWERMAVTRCFPHIVENLWMEPENGSWEVAEGQKFKATANVQWMPYNGNLFSTAGKTTHPYHLGRGVYLETAGLVPAGKEDTVVAFTVTMNVAPGGIPDTLQRDCWLRIRRKP